MTEWISVKDQLPENNTQVLIIDENWEMYVSTYKRMNLYYESGYIDRWNSGHCCGREHGDVIYWIPLPKPPSIDVNS